MSAMGDLVSVVQSRSTVLDGSTTMLNGIVSAAANIRTDPNAMSALFDDIQSNTANLAAAVVAGTCEAVANIKAAVSPNADAAAKEATPAPKTK